MATALRILAGRTLDPYLFGWNLEQWGSVLNLTFQDTAGLAFTDALHPGVLRHPGGTNANIWDLRAGEYVHPLPTASGYNRYHEFVPWISGQPAGTFSGASFLDGLGGAHGFTCLRTAAAGGGGRGQGPGLALRFLR